MNSEQTLEMKVKSKADEAVKSLDKLLSSLNQINTSVSSIDSKLNKTSGLKKAQTEAEGLNNSLNKAVSSGSKLGKALSLGTLYLGVKRLASSFLDWQKLSVDFTEQLNLFNVVFKNVEKDGVQTFSKLGQEATKFQYKLNEAFGTNMTDTLKYQALFQSMGENVGIPAEYAAKMSETMTKFTYDLASLYNKDESVTGEALRAGVYAGQTKPLRSYGIDVTQNSMQPILNQLGIDKTVKELSQAEKEVLRYIATLRQGSVAMGDFANTIDSPANQLKVFKQQLVEAKVALTSLFINAFAQILPYANAILMVIKEIAKAIASLFGIKLKDYNTGVAGMNNYADSVGGVGSNAGNAAKKVKELKREILGFDQIHNISETPENNGSGSGSSGGGVSGGIDQRLLDAIKGYDNGMEKVRMKATAIRDKIMEWLGFHKKINPLTGQTYFEYEGISKTLKNMWETFKGLSTEGKILVGLGLVAGTTKLFNVGKKLVTVFGNSGLGKVIKTVLVPFKTLGVNMLNLVQYTKVYTSLTGSLKNGIIGGIEAWKQQNVIVKDAYGNVDKFKTAMSGAKIAVQGLITGAVGLYSVHQSMKSLSTEGANLANVFGLVSGSLMTIASGVQIGAIFGPWGAVIGGATAALLTLISALDVYKSSSSTIIDKINETSNEINKFTKSMKEQYATVTETYSSDMALQGYYENLLKELNDLVDANGKVKAGYEDRANFIVTALNNAFNTEIEMTNGIISNIKEQTSELQKLIDEKRKQIALEMSEEKYKIAIDNKTESYKNLLSAKENLNKAQKLYNERLSAAINVYNDLSKSKKQNIVETYGSIEAYAKLQVENTKVGKSYKEAAQEYEDAKNIYKTNTQAIMTYQGLLAADASKNSDYIQQKIQEIGNSYVENGKVIKLNYKDQIQDAQIYYDEYLAIAKENGIEITESVKASANERYNAVISTLQAETKSVGKGGKVSNELVEAWHTLGKTNKTKFLEEFGKLDTEIQQKVVDKMYDKGYKISSELQKGMKQINPEIDIKSKVEPATVKIDADVSKAKKKTDSWLTGLFKNLGSALGISTKADGGMYYGGKWHNIAQYARGGLPSAGQMFIAREAGPELVGKIGNHTAVMNNGQIVDSVKAGVYEAVVAAMSQSGGNASYVDVRVHSDGSVVVDEINQITKQTGVCPIKI